MIQFNLLYRQCKFFHRFFKRMWNLKDSNSRVGLFLKLSSFKKHLQNLKSCKSSLSSSQMKPYRPAFNLSRCQNRYSRRKQVEVACENNHLVRRITNLSEHPKISTLIDVPAYVPSNKQNFKQFQSRQRNTKHRILLSENSMIVAKIQSASKSYDRKSLEKQWNESRIYQKNISRKYQLHDFRKMAEGRTLTLRTAYQNERKTQWNRQLSNNSGVSRKGSSISNSKREAQTERNKFKRIY